MGKIKFALMSLLFILLMSCQKKYENDKQEIEKVLNKLYSVHEGINETSRDSLFSKALLKKIETLREIFRKDSERIANSDEPLNKAINLEGALYSSVSDGFTKYTIKNVEINDKTAEAIIDFEFNTIPITKWTDKIQLINENGWKVDNVKYDTALNSRDDLNDKLDPLGFNPNYFKDVISNKSGQRLKLLYDKKKDTYAIELNSHKATLKRQNSAGGVLYSDGKYDLWFKGDNILLRKDSDEIFNNGVGERIDFIEAKNYYLKNDYIEKELDFVEINTQAELNKIFGAATTMGKEGTATKIDFNKYYAIAIIGSTNDDGNNLFVAGIYKSNDIVTVTVGVSPLEKGKKQTYSSRPFKILVIDKKYKGNRVLLE
jgi:hypothetical protein